jgi:hypothetical protein
MSGQDQSTNPNDPRYQEYLKMEAEKQRPGGPEVKNVTPEEISQKYIAEVPLEDRRITDPDQVKLLLSLLSYRKGNEIDSSDAFITSDRITKISGTQKSLMSGDRQGVINAMQEFADDPLKHADGTLHVFSTNTFLPESVKNAIRNIALQEGNNTMPQVVKKMVEQLKGDDSLSIETVIQKGRKELCSKESDGIRLQALKQLVESIYSEFANSPEVKLWLAIKGLSDEDKENPMKTTEMIRKYQECTNDSSFSGYSNPETIKQMLKSEGKFYDFDELLGEIRSKLEESIKEKSVTKSE